MKMNLKQLLIFFIFVNISYAWDSEELEVFDIVEEVKLNFYELLNVTKVKEIGILIIFLWYCLFLGC